MDGDGLTFDASYVERIALEDGTEVTLRPIRSSDKDLLADGFARMSPESRFLRFFGPKNSLSPAELRYLTEIDGETHFALGATRLGPDGEAQGVAVARFVRLPESPEIAEPAVAVVDELQGKGLGRALLVRLMAAGRERGVQRFRCHVMADNPSMLHLVGDLDPAAVQRFEEDDLVLVDFELPERPWDPDAHNRPRGRALHRFLALAAEGALRLRRAFAWLEPPTSDE